MPEAEAQKRKAILSFEEIKSYIWCLPLPFLVCLDVGHGIHIWGAAYYAALSERRAWKIPALFLAAVGLAFVGSAELRWKYGVLFLLITVGQWITEARFPDLSDRHKGLLLVTLLFLSVLLLNFSGLLPQYSWPDLLLEAGLFYGSRRVYGCFVRGFDGGERCPAALRSLTIGSMLAAGSVLRVGPMLLSETALCFGSLMAAEEDNRSALEKILPAAAVMRLTGTGSDGLLLWCLLLCLGVGALRRYGRMTKVIAAVVGSLLYLWLFMKESLVPGLLTLGVSLILFLLRPARSAVIPENQQKEEQQRSLQQLSGRAEAFRALAGLMPGEESDSRLSQRDMLYMLENVLARVCRDCDRKETCRLGGTLHNREMSRKLLRTLQERGGLEEKELPAAFRRDCRHTEEFVRLFSRHYELYRLNLSWENRMGKARCLLRGQYAAVASCLDRLREQVQQEFREEAEIEQRIQQCLKKNGILCEWLQVRSDRSEERPGQEIRMTLAFRTEMPEARERRCRELLGECLGIPVRRLEKRRERGGNWIYGYRDGNRISADCFGLNREAAGISGDSYQIGRLDERRYLLALSDGMGTGARAGEESGRALQTLEQLLLAGAEENEALAMLHASMVLGSREENFATLDLALLDLKTARLRLIKAGGAVTYLSRKKAVTVCRARTLPVGLLEEAASPKTFTYDLQPGDRLVMISDGVLDQLEDPKQGEEWIRQYLQYTEAKTARDMAEEIRRGLQRQAGDKGVRDDQTILTAIIRTGDRSGGKIL